MDKKRVILWAVIVLTLAFIFGQSLLSKDVSNIESDTVQKQVIEPVHRKIIGNATIKYNIRDVAHIVEFLALGLELSVLFRNKKRILQGLKSVGYCGFIALVDESLQYFSGRAPQVIDIWYDILGAIIGAFIGLFIVLFMDKAKKTEVN